jgi:succinate dehydrogenase / fumarate reductase cytochrome b subunit
MSQKGSPNRPTSPHLQIYKWNISSLTSILHRFTGIALYISIVAVVWYIIYYAYQINIATAEEACDCPMKDLFENIFTLAAIFITFSLYYHFCNGIRHLFWDLGKGFELKAARRNGYLVVLTSLVLTIATVSAVLYLKLF